MPCRCRIGAGSHDHVGDPSFSRDGQLAYGSTINQLIDLPKVQAWNAKHNSETAVAVVDPGSSAREATVLLESDADAELLLLIPFREFARIKGISIIGSGDVHSPSKVRLYTNRTNVAGFNEVRRWQHQDELLLANPSREDEIIYRIDTGKFLNVSNVLLFFPENFSQDEDEETHLLRVDFYGEPTGSVVNRPLATNVTYEARGNPADHPMSEEETKNRNIVL